MPSAPKPRQMLALLIMNANRVVTVNQFVEELWENSPPPSVHAAIHTYVMQLRRALTGRARSGQRQAGRLATREHGYLLVVRPGELDLDVFQEQVRAGRKALANGENARAAAQLAASTELWHGQVLGDVTAGPLLAAAIDSVEQLRLTALTDRIRADLRLGRHHELLGELASLLHCHPADERLAALLMVALYRSGRQADALATFHRVRRTLRTDFGVPPSPELSRVHMEILSASPRLEAPAHSWPRLSLDLVTAIAS
ncbi:AfsR/SARP family transcriptional regulator [Streptomyces niger]|uniref:AfsR/SARP family transcriptional regulator n=1 Tax=Streptomyces niger TaxID=66373 RepID=UPI00389ABE40